jgi:DNA-directed RNA polymerase specialized sigma24 family protein
VLPLQRAILIIKARCRPKSIAGRCSFGRIPDFLVESRDAPTKMAVDGDVDSLRTAMLSHDMAAAFSFDRPGALMSSMGSLTLCVQRLRSPDCRERDEAARVIWERFSARLLGLVRRHLDNRIRRREDEQDVLQSVYTSFCIGQFSGKTSPASREELWKLLVRITMCKVVNTANRHHAARRDVRRERTETFDPPTAGSLFPRWMLEHVDRSQPSQEEKIIVLDEVERLLHGLSPEQRRIVIWKLEGFTNAEIAGMIDRTVRSVELKIQVIRKRVTLGLQNTGTGSEAAQSE